MLSSHVEFNVPVLGAAGHRVLDGHRGHVVSESAVRDEHPEVLARPRPRSVDAFESMKSSPTEKHLVVARHMEGWRRHVLGDAERPGHSSKSLSPRSTAIQRTITSVPATPPMMSCGTPMVKDFRWNTYAVPPSPVTTIEPPGPTAVGASTAGVKSPPWDHEVVFILEHHRHHPHRPVGRESPF